MTFYGALAIDTGVLIDFGLQDVGMGVFLVLANVSILVLCFWLAWLRYRRDKLKHLLRRGKVCTTPPAIFVVCAHINNTTNVYMYKN
jgi:hypothetical protein